MQPVCRADIIVSGHLRKLFERIAYTSGLRGRETMLVKPFLEIRLGPCLIQPVSWIRSRLSNLLSNGFIVGAGLLEKGITSSRLGYYWRVC